MSTPIRHRRYRYIVTYYTSLAPYFGVAGVFAGNVWRHCAYIERTRFAVQS
jgi:hypothetical protein